MSATSSGPPTQAGVSCAAAGDFRRNRAMVGFCLPLSWTIRSRSDGVPGSGQLGIGELLSMSFEPKSKFSASDSSISESTSSWQALDQANLSSASAFGLGDTGVDRPVPSPCARDCGRPAAAALRSAYGFLEGSRLGLPDEDQLAPAAGEAAAAAALPGLDHDRMALRRARHGERAARAEVSPSCSSACTLSASAKRPVALSTISASSAQVSQWPSTTSMNSSARS